MKRGSSDEGTVMYYTRNCYSLENGVHMNV